MSWLRKLQDTVSENLPNRQFPASASTIPGRQPTAQHHQAPLQDGAPTPQNQTLLQGFEWHTPGQHYPRLLRALPGLAEIGITSVWLPPGCKGNDPKGNGYDCYDLWDLGEFDQKWTRPTKWGSREELDELISKGKELDVQMIWDAVLNHKTAGDATEACWAVEVDRGDRRIETSKPKQIEPWIHYYFPGRGTTYSSMQWHWQHFNGTDWCQRTQKNAIYKIVDPPESFPKPGAPATDPRTRKQGWATDVDDQQGNADYLMFSNVDYRNDEVRQDVTNWGEWMVRDVGLGGFRLDAVQHYSWQFVQQWVNRVKSVGEQQGRDIFVVGEFWMDDANKLVQWVERIGQGARAYDTPLLCNFSRASLAKGRWDVDLRKIFRDTLVEARPNNAVTLVANHDTQAGQTVATPIAPYFRAMAYTLILLRQEGLPCVFFGDLYGTKGPHSEPPSCWDRLPALIQTRKLYAYGMQSDYFDNRTCIGWTRQGTWDRKNGCAVLMSVAGPAKKKMFVGPECCGQRWTDIMGYVKEDIVINEKGFGIFCCLDKSVSVYALGDAPGREKFPVAFNFEIYKES